MLSSFSVWTAHITSDSIMNHDYDSDFSVTSHCFHGPSWSVVRSQLFLWDAGRNFSLNFKGLSVLQLVSCPMVHVVRHWRWQHSWRVSVILQPNANLNHVLFENSNKVKFVIPTLAACHERFMTGSLPYVVRNRDVTFS